MSDASIFRCNIILLFSGCFVLLCVFSVNINLVLQFDLGPR